MNRIIRLLLLPLGFVLLAGLDSCGDSPVEPRSTTTATANCGQNGSSLSIFCRDQSSDPRRVVVENGVRFEASLLGSAFQASRTTSIGGQAILDVTGGGFGTYTVDQQLIDSVGAVVASESYSVPVVEPNTIVAGAVRMGFVKPEDADAFRLSLAEDRYGVQAVRAGLISVTDAKTLGEMVFRGQVY